MDDESECYVCKKCPAKRCTSCLQIAYCSVPCQRSDWQYHRASCLQKTINVIDSLVKLQNFDHILRNICSYLSGRDLHYFGCVKRSWRDVIMEMRGSVVERRKWKEKLARQWRSERRVIRVMSEFEGDISKMEVNGSELFVHLFIKKEIRVYDITTNEFMYSLRAAEGNASVWDVHKDFLLIFDGKKIYLWDRHLNKEVDIDPSIHMQMGTHYKEDCEDDDLIGLEYKNTLVPQQYDVPVFIKIFPEVPENHEQAHHTIFIAYESGLVSRWEYWTPYNTYTHGSWHHDKEMTYDNFKFIRVASSDHIASKMNYRLHLRASDICIAQPYHNPEKSWQKKVHVIFKVGCSVELYDLEDRQQSFIDDVEEMYCFFESRTLRAEVAVELKLKLDEWDYEGYLIIKRKSMFDYKECILEVHVVKGPTELYLRRRMGIAGNVQDAKMNDHHFVVTFIDQSDFMSNSTIHIYDAKEIIGDATFCLDKGIKYDDRPLPIQRINIGHWTPCRLLLAGANRLIWNQYIKDQATRLSVENPEKEKSSVKCVNFWMV